MNELNKQSESIKSLMDEVQAREDIKKCLDIVNSIHIPESLKNQITEINKMNDNLNTISDGSYRPIMTEYTNNPALINYLKAVVDIVSSKNMGDIISLANKNAESNLFKWINDIPISQFSIRHEEFLRRINDDYMMIMFAVRWFPLTAWLSYNSVVKKVSNIFSNRKRVNSINKSEMEQIDNTIFKFYSKTKVMTLVRSWKGLINETHIYRILREAALAYLDGKYVLCISTLSTMWEGFIITKADDISMKERKYKKLYIVKKDCSKIINDEGCCNKIVNEFIDHFIFADCKSVSTSLEFYDIPNRHVSAHGWYPDYPSRKAALNAIIFTDFLLNL